MLSALTPSHADCVRSPPSLMGELEGVSLRKRQRRVLALLRRDDYLALVSEYSK